MKRQRHRVAQRRRHIDELEATRLARVRDRGLRIHRHVHEHHRMCERFHPAGPCRGSGCAARGTRGVDVEGNFAVERLRGDNPFHVLRGRENEIVRLTLPHSRLRVLEIGHPHVVVYI